MKRSIRILSLLVILSMMLPFSCKKNNGIDIEGIETELYLKIKSFRESHGITENFVHQFLLVDDAELISMEMKSKGAVLDSSRINHYTEVIIDRFGGANHTILMQITSDESADDIAANWTGDASLQDLLLAEYNQCAVGVEYDKDNVAYVTLIMFYNF